jgi:zinc transport system substrate-binding protein
MKSIFLFLSSVLSLKKTAARLLSVTLLVFGMSSFFLTTGCSKKRSTAKNSSSNEISIVTTIFAPYDFAREITKGTGDKITMLLPPGSEVHSWEPTAKDIIRIQDSSMFIYAGGEGDVWADKLIKSSDKKIHALRMIDCVKLFEEAHPDGMEPEKEDQEDISSNKAVTEPANETEWDEHVWMSPKNVILIVQKICDELCVIDSAHADSYKANTASYIVQLMNIDNEFADVVSHAERKTIVFADRFPARYFVEEFGLNYYAAFPGCAADTEPSASTVAFIINKVKAEKIPFVFYIELSNQKMADTVCEATGAKKLLFHCCHNLSKEDFKNGATYLSKMKENVLSLKQALGTTLGK